MIEITTMYFHKIDIKWNLFVWTRAKLTNFSRTEDIIKLKIFLHVVDPWFCCT